MLFSTSFVTEYSCRKTGKQPFFLFSDEKGNENNIYFLKKIIFPANEAFFDSCPSSISGIFRLYLQKKWSRTFHPAPQNRIFIGKFLFFRPIPSGFIRQFGNNPGKRNQHDPPDDQKQSGNPKHSSHARQRPDKENKPDEKSDQSGKITTPKEGEKTR